MPTTIRVSRRQIESARAAIEIAGGPDKVDPWIVKIANAAPAPKDEPEPTPKSS